MNNFTFGVLMTMLLVGCSASAVDNTGTRLTSVEKLNAYQVNQINGLTLSVARLYKRVYALEHRK